MHNFYHQEIIMPYIPISQYTPEQRKIINARQRARYHKNPAYYGKFMRKYYLKNKSKLNENKRTWRWKKMGLPVPEKEYSFFRDTIMTAGKNAPIWEELLSLNLTDRQKQAVHMARQGLTQSEVAAKLGVNQSSIAKIWAGTPDQKTGVYYGGIEKKLKTARQQKKSK
jgi:hypothetical protein